MESVKAWEAQIVIPTYKVGVPDKNPMFLEKRVYQGSSGVVYPHPVIDKVFDEKEDKTYRALYIENAYLKIMILPELGGRIQMAYDKTNDYHFIYYNRVIKPALVGLTGPWISGGIEFNWPQHHRPSTFNPVDYRIVDNADGSKTVWVNETEIMFHTKGMAGFTLYPGKAYLEVRGQLYNRTPFPQTFLWWANPAVEVDEHYQSVFPPDVHAVFDHGKRDVSSFPIATGTYYKVDYSPGTDISRYENIPVPTSYMAVNSAFDFVGGYHHQKKAGLLHVADHHISPGKKQWTWGSGAFGRTWDKHLTDPDEKGAYAPYFEVMTGVYTDNQPDFGWIMPNEERTFKQYFMPYKGVGYVKNANKDGVVNLEVAGSEVRIKVYVTAEQNGLKVILHGAGRILFQQQMDLSPEEVFTQIVVAPEGTKAEDLYLEVLGSDHQTLIDYRPVSRDGQAVPDPAKAIGDPAGIPTNEALYLAGLHLEQYRHATYSPVDYYEQALQRDPSDIRCNNALGRWYIKHGQFAKAEPYLRRAIAKIIRHNPNPYDGEPYYNLGLSLLYQQKPDAAYDAFYKACWNAAWQDNGYFQLACLASRKHDWQQALELVNHSLARNYHGMKARHLKAVLLRKMGCIEQGLQWTAETLAIDPFDFGSRQEEIQLLESQGDHPQAGERKAQLLQLLRGWEQSYLEIAIDYAHCGCYAEALAWLLPMKDSSYPMVHYYLAYYYQKTDQQQEAQAALLHAATLSPERVFPNRLEDIIILQYVTEKHPIDYKAFYYLGNLWYDKRQYAEACFCWEASVALNSSFATTHRNLAIAWYNKYQEVDKALQSYERAFSCDPTDARLLFELDQLYKKTDRPMEERLAFLKEHFSLVAQRDDLYIEYVTLHNCSHRPEQAMALLEQRRFHPWEGGEGKVARQYVYAMVAMAKQRLQQGKPAQAAALLQAAQSYPDNLGEGKLYGAQENDIFYWLGCAYQQQGMEQEAVASWEKAAEGLSEPVQAIYYNDQDPAMIFYQGLALQKLGRTTAARQRFDNLANYGRTHLADRIVVDFFAVSLPELSVFDADLDQRNRIHCHYLMGLGCLGSGDMQHAAAEFEKVLKMDGTHQGAIVHLQLLHLLKENMGAHH